eukprot:scaffold18452_cov71-Skeletonema_dohrnii-CCMP3373.AAC.1
MTATSISIAQDPESPGFNENSFNKNGFNENGQETPPQSGTTNAVAEMGMLINGTDDAKDGEGNEIIFPESSHSFLFTEPVKSIPFVFSLLIASMTYACLFIALINNVVNKDVPVNVSTCVRAAQYIGELLKPSTHFISSKLHCLKLPLVFALRAGILIALLMEEEIPTALFLLKRISKPILHSKYPDICYWKFVGSCILRFSMGYLFLANVVAILVLAEDVLEIFYDVLALQFLQQLDDIAFSVSKIEVLGKTMYLATMVSQMEDCSTTPYFTTGFKRQKTRFVMSYVSIKQIRGDYQCPSYTVGSEYSRFSDIVSLLLYIAYRNCLLSYIVGKGDEVWEEAYVHYPDGKILTFPLVFSNFNGHYKLDKSRTSEGRPIYVEHTKSDRTPFDTEVPKYVDPIKPAEFRYCGGRWMLVHDYIKKSKHDTYDTSDKCGPWLLRSQPYPGFDLGGAAGGWQIWEGKIVPTDVSLTCDKCKDDADCNLNGECNNGKCQCRKQDGVMYLGEHCEVQLKDECRTITSQNYDGSKVTWSADSAAAWIGEDDVYQEYSRPVYTYVEGLGPELAPKGDDNVALVYTGSRYIITRLEQAKNNATSLYWQWQTKNFHGFWAHAFDPPDSYLISEPTQSDTPVGVDFFLVGEQDEQYGPFGLLEPAFQFPGEGLFRCDVPRLNYCQFCSNGAVDSSFIVPGTDGVNCGELEEYSKTLSWKTEDDPNYSICLNVTQAEEVCCPAEWAAAVNVSGQVP